ncbi:MAG: hypothetical protein HY392_00430 [Candidatus Diapherotrites archaeon]|nr:hypothetical protein [Candidatus Diapherotrites archaeon]
MPAKKPGDRRLRQSKGIGLANDPMRGQVPVYFRATTKEVIGDQRVGPEERRKSDRRTTNRRVNTPQRPFESKNVFETINKTGVSIPVWDHNSLKWRIMIVVSKAKFDQLKDKPKETFAADTIRKYISGAFRPGLPPPPRLQVGYKVEDNHIGFFDRRPKGHIQRRKSLGRRQTDKK